MRMLSVVTFKWRQPGYHTEYTSAHVNLLARAVGRHYPYPHRMLCITDDAVGLDPTVEAIPLWSDFGAVPNPHGSNYPSCYRRLKLFDPAIADVIGPRFVLLDLDCLVTGDLRPIFDRAVDVALWRDPERPTQYNGSLLLMTAGARPFVWSDFRPESSPREARRAGCKGSDQGWLSYRLGADEAMFDQGDGVYSYRKHLKGRHDLPEGARLVFFHGTQKPWHDEPQKHAWVRAACH